MTATVLNEEIDSALCCNRGKKRVSSTFKTLRGLGMQFMTTRGTRDRYRVEVRGLEKDVRRRILDLGICTAHHTGDPQKARSFLATRRIRNDQILRIQSARNLVQSRQLFTRTCATNNDRSFKSSKIVGVHRLTKVKHHVIGDIHSQRKRAHSRHFKPLNHPTRRGSCRIDAAHNSSHKAICAAASVNRGIVSDNNGESGLVRLRNGLNESPHKTRITESRTRRMREFARNSSHREAIPSIRRHVDLKNFLAQTKERNHALANSGKICIREILLQDDDAIVVLAQAKLARRAHHSIRDVAVSLSCGNLERSGKNSTRQGDNN